LGRLEKASRTYLEHAEKEPEKEAFQIKGKGNYKPITYPQSGFKLEGTKL
jgi:hypothetical protein